MADADGPLHEIDRITAAGDDLYRVLGLSQDATPKDIKSAYRKLSRLLHPDKCSLDGAEEAFKKLAGAYDCLSQEDTRAHYDRVGSAPDSSGPQRDPEEVFREFAAANPDLAQFMRAGMGQGGGGATFNFNTFGAAMNDSGVSFNFSAAALSTMWQRWTRWANELPLVFKYPALLVGAVLYGLIWCLAKTMPFSAIAIGVGIAWLVFVMGYWAGCRLPWFMAGSQLPARARAFFPFWLQVVVMVAAERFAAVVFDLWRGVWLVLVMMVVTQAMGTTSTQQR